MTKHFALFINRVKDAKKYRLRIYELGIFNTMRYLLKIQHG